MRQESAKPIRCPNCHKEATKTTTKYGRRDSCEDCGLHSWHGKPLVSAEVHEARKHCHEIFDRLWKDMHLTYEISEPEGSEEYRIAAARINRSARARAYWFMSFKTGLPEKECHMADQADVEKLRQLFKAARDATPQDIRAWWKDGGEGWRDEQVAIAQQEKSERRERQERQRAEKLSKQA